MTGYTISDGYMPGVLGRVVSLHGSYYAEHWGFGSYFESKVASDLAEFLGRFDGRRDGLWSLRSSDQVEGAIAIDGIRAGTVGAHLRWFIVSDAVRGTGAGGKLMATAMEFCRSRGYRTIYLSTFAGLDAARHLYEKHGFVLVAEEPGTQWGPEVLEQRFECRL